MTEHDNAREVTENKTLTEANDSKKDLILKFHCSLCSFVMDYHYRGKSPPFAKEIM